MVLAPLQFSGRSLTPDVLGGIQQGQQVLQGQNVLAQQRLGLQQAEQAQAAGQQAQSLLARSRAGGAEGDINAEIGQLLFTNPKIAETLRTQIGLDTEAKKLQAAKFGFSLEQAKGDLPQQNSLIEQNIRDIEARGGNASHSRELLTQPEERRLQAAKLFQANALNREELAKLATGGIEQQRKPIDRTTLEKNLLAAGLERGTPAFQNAVKQILTKPTTTVQVGLKAEGEERKEISKVQARRFEKIIKEGETAGKTLSNLDQLEAITVDSGTLAPAKAALAGVIKDLGFEGIANRIADVGTAQAFQAVSGRLVQDVLNAATGPQTDDDAKRAAKTISQLGDDPKALKFKSDSLRALALRQRQRAEFVDVQIGGGLTFTEANKEWTDFTRKTPNISGVVKNPNTGLPLFFFQFEQIARQNKPDVSQEEIETAWRQAHGK